MHAVAVAGGGDPGLPGSARISRAGERVLAIANFCERYASNESLVLKKSSFRQRRRNQVAAATATQKSRPTQTAEEVLSLTVVFW